MSLKKAATALASSKLGNQAPKVCLLSFIIFLIHAQAPVIDFSVYANSY